MDLGGIVLGESDGDDHGPSSLACGTRERAKQNWGKEGGREVCRGAQGLTDVDRASSCERGTDCRRPCRTEGHEGHASFSPSCLRDDGCQRALLTCCRQAHGPVRPLFLSETGEDEDPRLETRGKWTRLHEDVRGLRGRRSPRGAEGGGGAGGRPGAGRGRRARAAVLPAPATSHSCPWALL